MKMLVLVFRYYLDEEMQALLAKLNVKAFSEAPRIYGAGEAGIVAETNVRPGHNACIFAVMPEGQVEPVLAAVREFVRTHRGEHGKQAPLRAFVLPCEQAI